MSDVVVRLYECYSLMPEGDEKRTLVGDALDEIRLLRTTIDQLRSVAGAVSMENPAFSAIKKEIR